MIQLGIQPDIMSYSMTICACAHAGLISNAEQIYRQVCMKFSEEEILAINMIEVYDRSNKLDKAEALARTVNRRQLIAWTTVLAGCKRFNDYDRMTRIRDEFTFLSRDPA